MSMADYKCVLCDKPWGIDKDGLYFTNCGCDQQAVQTADCLKALIRVTFPVQDDRNVK